MNAYRLAHPSHFLPVTVISALCLGGTARAVIDAGSITVPSIGHFFNPPQNNPPFPPFPGFVGDLLIGAGGATLNPVSINLDGDTQISFTIRAPLGQRFFIDVPDGAAPVFSSSFGWRTPSGDGGGSLGFSASFQDLQGAAPSFQNNSAVGDNNQFFMFGSGSASFTNDLLFSAVTLTVSYAPRATGNGLLTYQPYNPQNSESAPQFLVGYQTSLTTDPGGFVTLVPFTQPANLFWGSGGTSDNWSDAGNWLPNQAPANGDSLTFGFGARTTSYVDSAPLNVNGLSFNGGPQAYTIHVPESSTARHLTITGSLQNFSGISQTLIADGASAAGMNSGVLTIAGNSMSGPFTLIARGPTGGGTSGGVIELPGFSNASSARVIVEAGAIFDASARSFGPIVDSIEGGGTFYLGHSPIYVGGSNLNMQVSGTLADGGPSGGIGASLQKLGTGTLILSGANNYTGGTTIFGGIVEVRSPVGGLGSGNVSVNAAAQLLISQTAVAGTQTFTVRGFNGTGQAGGALRFIDTANAGGMALVLEGATVNASLNSGSATFEASASAGTAAITVQAKPDNGVGGRLTFTGAATASVAAITNRGFTEFRQNASAGVATMVNEGVNSYMQFVDTSSAGASNITNQGGPGSPGRLEFYGTSTAGTAAIHNLGSQDSFRSGGITGFLNNSTAGAAQIINEPGSGGGGGGGVVFFGNGASAGNAAITNRGGSAVGHYSVTNFYSGTTAGSATIINEAGTDFGAFGAATGFEAGSDAGTAHVTSKGSAAGVGPGYTFLTGSGATSILTAEGAAAAGGAGGVMVFNGGTAGNATLFARSSLVAGAAGGDLRFESQGSGGLARATVEAGAKLDISFLDVPSMTIGSIEGAGTFYLGSKELVIGGNNASTTVSGTIANGGRNGGTFGSITKVGTGALTIAGVNSYTGTTRVREGTLNLDSALPPNAFIHALGGVLNVNGDGNANLIAQPTGVAATVNITGDLGGSNIFVNPILSTATVNIARSEQLNSLYIGDGGKIVLTNSLPPAPDALQFDTASALETPAIPEPGIGALLASALAFFGARRRARSGDFRIAAHRAQLLNFFHADGTICPRNSHVRNNKPHERLQIQTIH